MATKPKPNLPSKVGAKVIAEGTGSGKKQVMVRPERVEEMKLKGYKVSSDTIRDKKGKALGVRTHCEDLVLMEK